jgi:hypothetical protein
MVEAMGKAARRALKGRPVNRLSPGSGDTVEEFDWTTLDELMVSGVADLEPSAPSGGSRSASGADEWLGAIARSVAKIVDQEKLQRQFVSGARAVGASWESIGKALGISMQGAQQRFGPTLEEDLPRSLRDV